MDWHNLQGVLHLFLPMATEYRDTLLHACEKLNGDKQNYYTSVNCNSWVWHGIIIMVIPTYALGLQM